MPIRFVCPFGHPLVVPDERAGKRGRCPVCRQRLIIPTPDDNSPALERLPWKRDWREEEINVDQSGGNARDSAGSAPTALGDRSATTVDATGADASINPLWSEALARLAVTKFQYPLDARRAWRARLLAVAVVALAIFSAAPAMAYLDGPQTHVWCWLALVASGLLAAGATGVLWLPDWSTLWCATWLAGFVGCCYFVALSRAIVAPADRPLPLGLESVRSAAAGWSGLIVLLSGALCYGIARLSSSWREEYEAGRYEWQRQRQMAAGEAAGQNATTAPAVGRAHSVATPATTPAAEPSPPSDSTTG